VRQLFQTNSAQVLERLSRHRDEIAAAVAECLDQRGWLPDEIIVVLLDSTEQIGRSLLSRLKLSDSGLVIRPLHLAGTKDLLRELDRAPESLAATPAHGSVRVLTSSGERPVVAHAQFITAQNYDQWRSRLDAHIDRALTHMALSSKPRGLPS